MNTMSFCAAREAGRKLVGSLLVPVLAGLTVMSAVTMAADPPPLTDVNAILRDKDGNPMTLAQMALQFARGLATPFVGTRPQDAIFWLMGQEVNGQPGLTNPLTPLGGWGDGSRQATVGDLTVILVQHFKIDVTAPTGTGGQATAQDYQNALTSYTGSTTVSTYTAIASVFKDWVQPTINVVGPAPQPDQGQQTRSSPNARTENPNP